MADHPVPFTADDHLRVDAFLIAINQAKILVRRSSKNPEQLQRAGKLGEVAFGRFFGHDVNWAILEGGDGVDFVLLDGTTVDVKSIAVEKNMAHDFCIPIGPHEVSATYIVQVLIAPDWSFGLITGGISRKKFTALAVTERSWGHFGHIEPITVKRSQLSQDYPPAFWASYFPAPLALRQETFDFFQKSGNG